MDNFPLGLAHMLMCLLKPPCIRNDKASMQATDSLCKPYQGKVAFTYTFYLFAYLIPQHMPLARYPKTYEKSKGLNQSLINFPSLHKAILSSLKLKTYKVLI